MFGGVPQPQTSRNGPKRPETAVFGAFLMPSTGRRPAERKFITFLVLVGDH